MSELALVVPFEKLAPVVDDLRERTCDAKPSHGMPPHVTLLVPAPRAADAISGVLAPFPAFDVAFARLDRFPVMIAKPFPLRLRPRVARSSSRAILESCDRHHRRAKPPGLARLRSQSGQITGSSQGE